MSRDRTDDSVDEPLFGGRERRSYGGLRHLLALLGVVLWVLEPAWVGGGRGFVGVGPADGEARVAEVGAGETSEERDPLAGGGEDGGPASTSGEISAEHGDRTSAPAGGEPAGRPAPLTGAGCIRGPPRGA